ncbi:MULTISPECIES: ABC transporter permease [Sinorhizobium]|uniref:Peptide ABC transporter permease n=1 Tax=Rhizobium meliloti (strain 1021) TaxID=266834 RepID=Q92LE4_RHIME|nr:MULTISPECIES: ABC transporter permease [Sinorhizobium]TWA88208.1 peptide/nickel transport system permease protein [Ensifer sp. SEMIA 134]TWB23795.1 peptide/nickel transport system permease protein [Ensifer sp. SEMIA 135]AGG75713.1 Peptide ABC transporter permease [Sinorhizobium meliloti 2011]ASP58486.1 ABC transporter permease [Sinorhizobium meliloti]MCK3802108.1 ABC transporter permease [Sinorhizobium meliloti]
MIRYLIARILSAIPVIGVVTIVVFGLTYLGPGDAASLMAGDYASPADIAALRVKLHLDDPIITQYIYWLGNVLKGDFGHSIFSQQPVLALILSRVEPTITLAIAATLVAVVVAVPLGLLAAHNKGGIADQVVSLFGVAGTAIPAFLIGYLLIFAFGVYYGSMPIAGFAGIESGLLEMAKHVLLPAIMLGFAQTALISRITRASAIEALNQDFVRVARAKGLDEITIMIWHCLKPIAVPVITIVGTSFAHMLGGVVITETVFAIPGIGSLLVEAIQHKDIPVIQGVLLLSSLVYVLVNLLVDLSYLIVDPRIKYT